MNPSLRLPAATAALAAAALLGSHVSAVAQEASPATPAPAATVAPAATIAPAVSVAPVATITPAPTPTPTPIDPAVRAAAESLVTAMHTQQVVENSGKQLQTSVDQIADRMNKTPSITPELTGEVQKMRDELHALVTQKLGWDTMKEDIVGMYAENFSEAELKEITAFYHTPVGEKLVEKQPELTDKLGKVMRQKSMAVIPAVQQRIRALSIKLRPAPPAVPMASPGASPGASSAAVTPAGPMLLPHAAPTVSAAPATPTAVATPAASPVTSAPVAAPTP